MKSIWSLLLVMLPVTASYAGGYDVSGNGTSLRDLIAQVAGNCSVALAIKNNMSTKMFCPDGGNSCNFSIDQFKATNVVFDDGAVKNIIPISYGPPVECGEPCTKRNLTFITRVKGKLVIDTRELDVDSTWAHENVVGIKWKSTDNKQYGVTKFQPASFSVAMSADEKNALVDTIQKNPDGEDLKNLSCQSASHPTNSAETRAMQ